MDFHGMKRKRLQSLCKKHGIPANLKNREMADRLSIIFKEKEKSGSCQSAPDNSVTEKVASCCTKVDGILEEKENNQEALAVVPDEQKSSSLINNQMVASDTITIYADTSNVKIQLSKERSLIPDSEESICFSPKLPKYSVIEELEDITNLTSRSPRDIFGTFDEKETMHSVKKENVNNSQEVQAEPDAVFMNHANLPLVSSEEHGYHLEEGEVNKKDDQFDVHDDVYGDEAKKLVDTESPKGSTRDRNILGKSNLTSGHFPGEVQVATCKDSDTMFVLTMPQTEVKSCNLNIEQSIASVADLCLRKDQSSQKRGSVLESEKSIGSSPKLLKSSVITKLETKTNLTPRTPRDILVSSNMKERMQSVRKENVENSNVVLNTVPNVVMNDVNLLLISSEGSSGYHLVEGETNKLGGNVAIHDDVCETKKGNDEAEMQSETTSSKGSKKIKNTLGKTSLISGPSLHDVGSTNCKDSDEIPDQFLPAMLQIEEEENNQEVLAVVSDEQKSSSLINDQMLASDTVAIYANTCDVTIQLSQKRSVIPDSLESICSSPKLSKYSVIKELEDITNLTSRSPRDIFGTFNEKETMQSVKKENVDNRQEVHAEPDAVFMNRANLPLVSSEEHGYHLEEGKVKKKGDKFDVHDDVYGDEAKRLVDTESPNGSTRDRNVLGKSNLTSGHFPGEAEVATCEDSDTMFVLTMPQPEINSCNLNTEQRIASDLYLLKLQSSQKRGSVLESEKSIGSSPKLLKSSVIKELETKTILTPRTPRDILVSSNMKEGIQSVRKEKVKNSDVVLNTEPNVVMNHVKHLLISSEDSSGYHLVEGETNELGGNVSIHEDICETKIGDDEAEKQFDTRSSKGSKKIKTTLGKTNLISGPSLHDVRSTNCEDSDEIPDQFLSAMLQIDVSCNINTHEMVSSVKTPRGTFGTCNMKENRQSAKKDQVGTILSKKTFPKRQALKELQ